MFFFGLAAHTTFRTQSWWYQGLFQGCGIRGMQMGCLGPDFPFSWDSLI